MTTIRTEWMITGDPGPGYQRPYRFVWGPDYIRMRGLAPDRRWVCTSCGEAAEQ